MNFRIVCLSELAQLTVGDVTVLWSLTLRPPVGDVTSFPRVTSPLLRAALCASIRRTWANPGSDDIPSVWPLVDRIFLEEVFRQIVAWCTIVDMIFDKTVA